MECRRQMRGAVVNSAGRRAPQMIVAVDHTPIAVPPSQCWAISRILSWSVAPDAGAGALTRFSRSRVLVSGNYTDMACVLRAEFSSLTADCSHGLVQYIYAK